MSGQVTELPIPVWDSGGSMAAGPDGNLWITKRHDSGKDAILRVTTTGSVSEFRLPHKESGPQSIVAGPDGNIWFTEYFGGRIGRITPGGKLTEFDVKGILSFGIAAGSDGNVWFREFGGLGRITPAGKLSEYSAAGDSNRLFISDGRGFWFDYGGRSARMVGRAGRISNTAVVRFTGDGTWRLPESPDGRLWYTALGEPPCEGGGGTCMAQIYNDPGVVGWALPPRLSVTIGRVVSASQSPRRVGVQLVCAAESAPGDCGGQLRLSTYRRGGNVVLGQRHYALRGDEVGDFVVRLNPRGRRLLEHHRLWVKANATVEGGEEASGGIVLGLPPSS
jgi:hypothetical protein